MLRQRKAVTLALLCSVLFVFSASAQDWPQWRGPNRDGAVRDFTAPESWPSELKQVWKTPVGGGYASPVVASGKAWIHSRKNDEELVSCLDLETGKIRWTKSYPASFAKNQYATQMGKGPHATPLLYAGKLYTFGVTTILSCFDAETGELKWRKEFPAPNTAKLFCGTAASPLIDQGRLIVYAGDDQQGGTMVALDPGTGKQLWNWKGEGPGYASPIIVELQATRHVITMTDKSVIGIDSKTGKLLWRMPWPDEWNENIVTPVQYKDLVIFSGVRKGCVAVHLEKSAAGWTAKTVWENKDILMYMNSPVVEGDHLFGMSSKRKGQYFCMEAATGKVLWTTEGREGANASILNAGDFLFFLNSDAGLIVSRRSPAGFEMLAKYSVGDAVTYAHPVLFNNRILIKDEAAVTLWSF
jgi:outer membrane protein assembly factor BamB